MDHLVPHFCFFTATTIHLECYYNTRNLPNLADIFVGEDTVKKSPGVESVTVAMTSVSRETRLVLLFCQFVP